MAHRIGPDKFLASFRTVMRSADWDPAKRSPNKPALYDGWWAAFILRTYEQALSDLRPNASALAQRQRQNEQLTALQQQLAQAQSQLAQRQRECEELRGREERKHLESPVVAEQGGGGLEDLQKRDRQIQELKGQLKTVQEQLDQALQQNAELRLENDKLLVMLADQELTIEELKSSKKE